jgi:hypothetical protein
MGYKMRVKDTSKEYEDLVGFKAPESQPIDLSSFIEEDSEHKPNIKPKPVDPDYPDDWQKLYVNLNCMEDYVKFMELIGEFPGPKIKKIIFNSKKNNGLLNFFEE